jgi:predicted NAD/FAD-binding protein
MLRDILRFNREAPRLLHELSDEDSLADFLDERRYSREFAEHYLLPMGAAIWSCPPATFAQFPVRFIIEFYTNHGLLQVRDRPVWRTIEGGSKQYVERLIAPFRSAIRLQHPVRSVFRTPERVMVMSSGVEAEPFDEVIFACHSDQALRILDDADPRERSVLSALPYGGNTAVLHTDVSVLPRRRRAWASWNYRLNRDPAHRPSVTYNMNILQHIRSPQTFCVTLNSDEGINPGTVLGTFQYSHPVFTTRRTWAQHQHSELIRRRRTSFCGAYWGNGFHEDGVNSAIAVCRGFGVDFDGATRPMESTHRGVFA